MADPKIGVIGGSGLYDIPLEDATWHEAETPFGPPSDRIRVGRLEGADVAFLARHGQGHRILPGEVPFRANIWALKALGVERILSASAVGSLREDLPPRDVVIPDQFIDRTRHRPDTFFGDGVAVHVSLADPFCPQLRGALLEAGEGVEATVHDGGTYICMEGPQFSTRAESHLYRSWGASVIGMTNLTEARLAREAEICYATIALVTDYDCWHEEEEDVSVETVVENLRRNARTAEGLVRGAVSSLPAARDCGCGSALGTAIITRPDAIPPEARERLALLLGSYLG